MGIKRKIDNFEIFLVMESKVYLVGISYDGNVEYHEEIFYSKNSEIIDMKIFEKEVWVGTREGEALLIKTC